jgi:hypothetical protein
MNATVSSEMLVRVYQAEWRHVQDDRNLMATDRMYLLVCGLHNIAVSDSEYSVEIGLINRKV